MGVVSESSFFNWIIPLTYIDAELKSKCGIKLRYCGKSYHQDGQKDLVYANSDDYLAIYYYKNNFKKMEHYGKLSGHWNEKSLEPHIYIRYHTDGKKITAKQLHCMDTMQCNINYHLNGYIKSIKYKNKQVMFL